MGFNFDISKELQQQIEKCGNLDEIAPKMLKGAAPIVVEAVKQRVPVNTGNLKKCVMAQEPKQTKNGAHICNINFPGKNKKDRGNIYKAVAAEYGNSKRAATPFIRPAIAAVKDKANEKMKEIYLQEVKK